MATAPGSASTITLSMTDRSMSGMSDGDERGPERHAERDEHLALVTREERPEASEPTVSSRVAPVTAPALLPSLVEGVAELRRARPGPPPGSRRGTGRRRAARASRARRRRARRGPSAVICSRSARRSSSAMARVTRPRSASVSIVAETVGLVSARCPASWLARSAPSAIMASSRYWDRVRSVHARSSRRARRARVRTAAIHDRKCTEQFVLLPMSGSCQVRVRAR